MVFFLLFPRRNGADDRELFGVEGVVRRRIAGAAQGGRRDRRQGEEADGPRALPQRRHAGRVGSQVPGRPGRDHPRRRVTLPSKSCPLLSPLVPSMSVPLRT